MIKGCVNYRLLRNDHADAVHVLSHNDQLANSALTLIYCYHSQEITQDYVLYPYANEDSL